MFAKEKFDKSYFERLTTVINAYNRRKLAAQAADVSVDQIARYLRMENYPSVQAACGLCEGVGYSIDWLTTGRGNKHFTANSLHAPQPVPILGLAECGLEGWFDPKLWDSHTTLQLDDKESFAVIAHGQSMRPEGIRQGFICFCSPNTQPSQGDCIFIRSKDGKATIKQYVGMTEDGWLKIKGYLDPDEDRIQHPYNDQVRLQDIEQIAVVTIIKRKI